MPFDRVTKVLTLVGYVGLSLCGVPQWWHMATTGDVAGVSLPFLVGYAGSLLCLQVAFALGGLGRALVLGNFAGLCNAAACLGLYLVLTAGR
ncbi:MAG: hypothetical protein LDL07_03265 [Desulfarculus sp.]|nr:hypothetical protein [Desulfarculus sp.]